MAMPQLLRMIESFRLPRLSNDQFNYSKMNNDQYIAFRHAFVHQRAFQDNLWKAENAQAIEMVLSVICMILCNRVPKGVVTYNTAALISKIKLVQAPRGIELKSRVEVKKELPSKEFPEGRKIENVIPKNTNERAVVRILVPFREMTQTEMQAEDLAEREALEKAAAEAAAEKSEPTSPKTSTENSKKSSPKKEGEAAKEEKKEKAQEKTPEKKEGEVEDKSAEKKEETVEPKDLEPRFVEVDQDEKAVAIANRVNLTSPYTVLVMN